MLTTTNSTTSSAGSGSTLSTEPLTLPLPSIFQNPMNPSTMFNPPSAMTPNFLLPTNTSSMMSHNFSHDSSGSGGSGPYSSGLESVSNDYQSLQQPQHQHQQHQTGGSAPGSHYTSPGLQYNYLYLQQSSVQQQQQQQQQQQGQPQTGAILTGVVTAAQTSTNSSTTPSKSPKRKLSTEKKEPLQPNAVPKCTRCNETASWKHDKRRWWCKECKKAFTPGISKAQNTNQTPSNTQWDATTSIPPAINCPGCGSANSWKQDKKRWHCKECKRAYTPNQDGATPSSPTSPKSKSKSKSKKSSSSSVTASTPSATPSISPSSTLINSGMPNPMTMPSFYNTQLPSFHQMGTFSNLPHPPKDILRTAPAPMGPGVSPMGTMNMPSQFNLNNLNTLNTLNNLNNLNTLSNLNMMGSMVSNPQVFVNQSLSPNNGSKKISPAMPKVKKDGVEGHPGLMGVPENDLSAMGAAVTDYSKLGTNKISDLRYLAS